MSDSDFDVMLLITMINRESNVSSANYIEKKNLIANCFCLHEVCKNQKVTTIYLYFENINLYSQITSLHALALDFKNIYSI